MFYNNYIWLLTIPSVVIIIAFYFIILFCSMIIVFYFIIVLFEYKCDDKIIFKFIQTLRFPLPNFHLFNHNPILVHGNSILFHHIIFL